ncbi:MAG: DUF4350 domain-containing protein [Cyanomargarita calcarea GSE-NOS-MK-12-04C]|jgi:hypothetical protein|uniref:DUF4350 domain-containing protein n=1 Tax=Cyanomargarita calcarea GSE-NOS-MK-12-04C TaxID=2839659 RepID=A0A951USI2_9CYAN|nr:DUF4350 domain-containing protein [Cyanomargarita calcarea GSE-NOS-MK-12-04C]
MKRSNRRAWLGAIALSFLVILSLILAPGNNRINSGSTYNRSPDGYGAWYAFMQEHGTNITRFAKPFKSLKAEKTPVTLLRVNSQLLEPIILPEEKEWLENGNTLIILGVRDSVTAANFSTMQKSSSGDVKIETRRRGKIQTGEELLLGDRFGAVVWQQKFGQGKVIFSTTPHLAANAYQENLSNFNYLADLLGKKNNLLLVDEYLHGYKDAAVRQEEGQGNLISYFSKTPVFPALLQVGVLLLVLIWALNQRFGKEVTLYTPVVDNSEAYIQALAQVLQKAGKTDFVVEMVAKEEQVQLQLALGLGRIPLEHQALVTAWVQQTGTQATELDKLLRLRNRKTPMSERDLISWLGKWQTLREVQNSTLNRSKGA